MEKLRIISYLSCWFLFVAVWSFQPPLAKKYANHNTRQALHSRRSSRLGMTELEASDGQAVEPKRKFVVVGGGWAGFSATDSLASSVEDNVQVELLDASPRGVGGLAGGWTSPNLNRSVEVGIHGFWREYRNTFAAIERIGLNVDDVLTPYTPSVLVSESGRVATAPVLGSESTAYSRSARAGNLMDITNPSKIIDEVAATLPPPLDLALMIDSVGNTTLSNADRASAVGLLGAWADFDPEDSESWEKYDGISAEHLFLGLAGVSPALYRELVTPLLHVLPMCPGYDCSAAAALSCFHVFAFQAKGAFDVRWCSGTISDKIFNPWATKLIATGKVGVRGGARVSAIEQVERPSGATRYAIVVNGEERIECDGIVLAVGGTAIQRILPAEDPLLKDVPISATWTRNRGVTCVAVRLFIEADPVITAGLSGGQYDSTQLPPDMAMAMKDSPVFVCGPRVGKNAIPQLAETGFCLYDLQRLQDEFAVGLSRDEIAVLEIDFFRANLIADMNDEDILLLSFNAIAEALNTNAIARSRVVDLSVVRARDAVSHFCVDSASTSPPVKLKDGLYVCGDWIDRKGHASWSTEKSVVTGRQAVAALAADYGLKCQTDIISTATDSEQVSSLKAFSKAVDNFIPKDRTGIPAAPWVAAQQLQGSLMGMMNRRGNDGR